MAVILSPGDHWPGRVRSDTLVHYTPLLSGFKKTKLKHGAVCLTSLVFRHLRFGQSPGVAPPCPHQSPELSVSMSYSALERNLSLMTICMQRIPATVIAW